jgi:hypothetical protein
MDSPRPISDNIKKYVDDALFTVPEGDKGAIVTYVDDDGNLRGVVALRANDNWTLAAHIDRPAGEKPGFGAAVRFSWG